MVWLGSLTFEVHDDAAILGLYWSGRLVGLFAFGVGQREAR